MSFPLTREMFKGEFVERLKSCRSLSGLSLQELSERTGISRGSLGDYFRGQSEPSSWILARLAEAMGADANYLLGLNPPKKRKVGA